MKRTIILLLSTLTLAACSGDKKGNKTEQLAKLKKERAALDKKIIALETEVNKNKKKQSVPVNVIQMTPQTFSATIDVQAQITGDQNVLASSQSPGVIKRILVRPGQHVSKGQTLAVLDAAAIEQQINAQQAQLTLAKQLYDKQKRLWEQNIGTQVQLLQAKANYDAATSQRAALVAQKDMFTIKSPISGIVDDVSLKEGDMSAPGMNGIRVVSKDKLKAEAQLGENYLGEVQSGDPVSLVFPESNLGTINTRLSYVSQAVNPISRSFNVEVKLAPNAKLHPNMSCQMKIVNYQNNKALLVPVSAIQKVVEGEMVFVVEGGKARSVIIETGRNSNGMVEVKAGLSEGDQVVTVGFEDLEDGEPVNIKPL